jgi:hypothetical protein
MIKLNVIGKGIHACEKADGDGVEPRREGRLGALIGDGPADQRGAGSHPLLVNIPLPENYYRMY